MLTGLLLAVASDASAQSTARRSRTEIEQSLKKIESRFKSGKGDSALREALVALNQYRYLCGVPPDVELKADYTELAQAAAEICALLGNITHTPSNPGLSEDAYRKARDGAGRSNLAVGANLPGSVHMYMFDSDPSNIDRVGHRRWCINPAMRFTGFGIKERFSAMYSMDGSREEVPESDFIAYPPAGLMPAEYFGPRHAWHVSVNLRKYRIENAAEIKVALLPLKKGAPAPTPLVPPASALKLDAFHVDLGGMGGGPAIIFRSPDAQPAKGRRYAVVVYGLKDSEGNAARLSYVTEFF